MNSRKKGVGWCRQGVGNRGSAYTPKIANAVRIVGFLAMGAGGVGFRLVTIWNLSLGGNYRECCTAYTRQSGIL